MASWSAVRCDIEMSNEGDTLKLVQRVIMATLWVILTSCGLITMFRKFREESSMMLGGRDHNYPEGFVSVNSSGNQYYSGLTPRWYD